MLAALSAIGPFAIDTYLPAFPAIAADLGASPLQVQQTLTVYLGVFALMTLWHGAISDALGRRRVVLWSLGLFFLSSVACMFATRIEHLLLARAAQGVCAGAGMVVGRAVVRDVLEGPAAQRLMSAIQMLFALAPALAPIVGGWVFALAGWRATFGFLAMYSALLWLACRAWLPETLPPDKRVSLHPVVLLRGYRQVFSHRRFQWLVMCVSANFAGFFIYVLSAPVFLMQHLGVSAQGFAWLFGPTVAGMMAGSWLSGRLAGTASPLRMLSLGYALMLCAALANVLLNAMLTPRLPWPVLPIALYNVGQALAMPVLTLLALDLFPRRRGMVSSCQGFVQSSVNAAVAGLIAPLAWASTLGLALGMSAFASLGALGFAAYRHHLRTAHDDPPPPGSTP